MEGQGIGSRSTRRSFIAGVGLAGAGAFVAACGGSSGEGTSTADKTAAKPVTMKGSGELNLSSPGGAFEEARTKAIIEPFQDETGIKVNLVDSGTSADFKADIVAKSGKFDLHTLQPDQAQSFADEGLLAPIDFRYWNDGDRAAVKPTAPTEFFTPQGYYSINIAYAKSKLAGAPASWADFWDTTRFAGKRTLYDGTWGAAAPLPEAALLADGVTADALYPVDLDKAFASLDQLRAHILKMSASGEEPVQLITSGDVTMGCAYNTRVQPAIDAGEDIAMSFDQAFTGLDTLAVSKNAPNLDNAMRYLAYISRPEPAAELAKLIPYSPPNEKAFALVPEARQALLATSPVNSPKVIARDYGWWADNGTTFVKRYQQWLAD